MHVNDKLRNFRCFALFCCISDRASSYSYPQGQYICAIINLPDKRVVTMEPSKPSEYLRPNMNGT